MLNHITIMGRLVRPPELRHTQSGTSVVSFTLAVDRDFKSKDTGEKATDFIECVAWKNTADFIASYFSKGRMAVVEGKLQTRDWTDKEGNKRKASEVIVDSVYFGDSKKETGDNASAYSVPAGNSQFSDMNDDYEDDLPY